MLQLVQPVVQRSDQDAPVSLRNSRFSAIPPLVWIANGHGALRGRHNGAPVRAVQQALSDMAYGLPRYRADGKIGSETRTAIERFRADKGVNDGSGLEKSAMIKLDETAPAPGRQLKKSVDYQRMLSDGRLDITVAYGYESAAMMHPFIAAMTKYLTKDEGFLLVQRDTTTGFHRYVKFMTFEVDQRNKPVLTNVKIIAPKMEKAAPDSDTPKTKQPKQAFRQALTSSDVAMYLGHARYGTGPDFDPKKDAAENFVIGVGSALHRSGALKGPKPTSRDWYRGHEKMRTVLEKRANDLEQMVKSKGFDKKKYRVWFFDACTTLHYLDELRDPALMGGVGRKDLDILGTRSSINAGAGSAAAIAFIHGILHANDIHALTAAMQEEVDNTEATAKANGSNLELPDDQFFHDGFGDNPVQR